MSFSDGDDEMEMDFLRDRTRELNKIVLVNWKEALAEAAKISGVVDLDPRGKMKIADKIDLLVMHWMEGFRTGVEIPIREMESYYDLINFLLKQWREVFCEPVSISEVAFLDPRLDLELVQMRLVEDVMKISLVAVSTSNHSRRQSLEERFRGFCLNGRLILGRVEMANVIEFHVQHCREALFQAAGISGGAVLNSCGEMEITNAIELHMKHWKDSFSEEAGAVLDSKCLWREIRDLMNHWREKLFEASRISGDKQLSSSREIEIEQLLESWRKALAEAVDNSTGAVFESRSLKMLKAYNRIESLLNHWRMALCEAVAILRLVVEHLRGIKDNDINNLVKHAGDDLREAASISGVVILNSGLLELSGVKLVGDFVYLSKDLRWLCWHGFPLAFIPESFYQGNLVSIELENNVQNRNSNDLSDISVELPKLQSLWIECGSDLQLSRDTSSILDALYATNSEESESSGTTSQMQNVFTLIECNSSSKRFEKTLLIQMGTSWEITRILKQRILQNRTTSDGSDCLLPGDCYPDWLTFSSKGSSVTFEIPRVKGRNLKTMMCHTHYSSSENITSDGLKNLLVINHTKTTIQLYKRNALASFEDEEWQRVLSNIEPGNKVQIVVIFWSGLTVNKTTIYLIYEGIDEKDHAPNLNVSRDESSPRVESMEDMRANLVSVLLFAMPCSAQDLDDLSTNLH
ncbi:hypothetical protein ACSQ67_020513 [Phaseolus vulgaris]